MPFSLTFKALLMPIKNIGMDNISPQFDDVCSRIQLFFSFFFFQNLENDLVLNIFHILVDSQIDRSVGGKKPKNSGDEGPSMTELSGYNPKRKEFDPEYDNDAEQMLAEMEFKDTDTEAERELKLRVLRIYCSRCAIILTNLYCEYVCVRMLLKDIEDFT